MTERFSLEYNEAAPTIEAAFILDKKSGLKVRISRFRTLKQLDEHLPSGFSFPVRNLPILLEALPNNLTERNLRGVMNRMAEWYYYTQLNPPPANTSPVDGSAD